MGAPDKSGAPKFHFANLPASCATVWRYCLQTLCYVKYEHKYKVSIYVYRYLHKHGRYI